MTNTNPIAHDRIGQEISVGSLIVAPYTRSRTVIGRVTRITPQRLHFDDIDRNVAMSQEARPINSKRHDEVVCIDKLEEHVLLTKLTK